MSADKKTARHHEWDDDGCCLHCGFDGAEFHHWKHYTYEGRARPDVKQPPCKERQDDPGRQRVRAYW